MEIGHAADNAFSRQFLQPFQREDDVDVMMETGAVVCEVEMWSITTSPARSAGMAR